MPQQSNAELLEMTTDIVASFVANNPVPASGLPDLIQTVHATVLELASDEPTAPPRPDPAALKGASPIAAGTPADTSWIALP